MRSLAFLAFALALPLAAQTPDEKAALEAVQKVFLGMSMHDAAMIRSIMLADARLYSLGDQATPAPSISASDFADRIAALKGDLLERFTAQPSILLHGSIAQVWGAYEFLLDGKFHHCGIDAFTLLKTADGWKIAAIADTRETTGCPGR
jgi:hypothetical protein